MFSPSVSLPLMRVSPATTNCEYSSTMQAARSSKALASAGVHHSRMFPFASNLFPVSSKPWVSSWPMSDAAAP